MAETELAKIVGNDNVLALPKVLEEYSRDLSFVPQVMPGYVVKPADVKEVQGVVKWANETKTSLVPVSSDRLIAAVIRFPVWMERSLSTSAG
jgi:glycolate oxidase